MARFCSECGAPLDDDARFCSECGATVDAPPQPAVSEAPPAESGFTTFDPGAAQTSGPAFTPSAPKERKPLPKWVLPVGIAALVVIVALAVTSFVLKSINSPEKVTERFLAAAESGDFSALSKVAVLANEDVELTEESAAPFFLLYSENTNFQRTLESLLESDTDLINDGDDPIEGNIVDLASYEGFLHTGYRVVIETCQVEIESNLICTVDLGLGDSVEVTNDGSYSSYYSDCGPDYGEYCAWGEATVYDLLPGRYTMSGSVTNSLGQTFSAEETLDVTSLYAYGTLSFEYQTLELYNASDVDVDIYIGGSLYGTVASYVDALIGPIDPETEVEARATFTNGDTSTQTFLAGDNDGYTYLRFIQCKVTVKNTSAYTLYVYQDDQCLAAIEPKSSTELTGLPYGTQLLLQFTELDAFETVEYTCEYATDRITPSLTLSDDQKAAIQSAVDDYASQCFTALSNYDTAAMTALAQSPLTEYLTAKMESYQSYSVENNGYTMTLTMTLNEENNNSTTLGSYRYLSDDAGTAAIVEVYCSIPYSLQYTRHYPASNEEDASSSRLTATLSLQYNGDSWEVIG
jgi:hypothetical protein